MARNLLSLQVYVWCYVKYLYVKLWILHWSAQVAILIWFHVLLIVYLKLMQRGLGHNHVIPYYIIIMNINTLSCL